jgi:hypothetical protein
MLSLSNTIAVVELALMGRLPVQLASPAKRSMSTTASVSSVMVVVTWSSSGSSVVASNTEVPPGASQTNMRLSSTRDVVTVMPFRSLHPLFCKHLHGSSCLSCVRRPIPLMSPGSCMPMHLPFCTTCMSRMENWQHDANLPREVRLYPWNKADASL